MGAFDQKLINVNDPTPIGAVIQAIGIPNSNYLRLSGQAILKSAYPALTGTNAPLANDPYRWEGSSFLTTRVPTAGTFNQNTCNKENQLGYGGGKFWAVGTVLEGGYIQSSSDGITWSESLSLVVVGCTVNGIIWCGGSVNLYIAYGGISTSGRQIWSSPDLVNWTNRYNEGSGTLQIAHGDFDGTNVCLISGAGAVLTSGVYTSTNGTSYTANTLPGTTNQNTADAYIKYFSDFGIWVAAYKESGGSANHIVSTATTPSGTWTSRLTLAGATYGYARKIVRIGNRIVIIPFQDSTAANRTIRFSTSSDGLTWNYKTGSGTSSGTINDIASKGDLAVASLTDSGTGFTSLSYTRDGMLYQRCNIPILPGQTSPTTGYGGSFKVYWDGTKFVATASQSFTEPNAAGTIMSALLVSYDGISFQVLDCTITATTKSHLQIVSDGYSLVSITDTPDIRTTIPNYNTSTSVYLPNRTNNGIHYFVRAK